MILMIGMLVKQFGITNMKQVIDTINLLIKNK